VIFEVMVPSSLVEEDETIRKKIINKLKEKDPKVNVIVDSIIALTEA